MYRALAETYPDEFSSNVLEDLFDLPPTEFERRLKAILIEAFVDKTMMLVVENLDRLFDGLGDAGQKKWRSFLQEHPITCTIATTQKLFAGVSQRKNPFFGFFDPIHLQPLSVKEAHQLLLKIAEQGDDKDLQQYIRTPEGRSRVRALHHLAGGNHRVYIVLSDFITRDSLDELVGPFEKMLDELTPYYQERMRWLSAQQRQIVEFLCTRTAPCPAKVIARHLFAAENTIGGQMKKLRDFGYVISTARGRESLYELTEPLMRLSYEVKENRREPMRLIVDFLRIWYRPGDLMERLRQASSNTLRAHISAAVDRARTSDDPRLQVIQDAIDEAKRIGRLEEAIEALEEKAHTVNTSSAWFELALYLNEDEVKRYEEAVTCYDKALEADPKFSYAWQGKSDALHSLQRYEEALACLDQVLEINQNGLTAWYNKGYALDKLQRHDKAIICYDQALKIDPKHVNAWHNKGNSLNELQRHDEAIVCYDQALEIDSKDIIPRYNKGISLDELERYDEAIVCYDQALEIDPKHARTWYSKGNALDELERYDEAIVCYDQALEIDPKHAYAWNNKGGTLNELERYNEAIVCYDQALEIDPKDAYAWNNKGNSLYHLQRYDEAIVCYDQALEIDPKDAYVWNNKGRSLVGLQRYDEAIVCYDQALEIDPTYHTPAFNRCEPLFELHRWKSGFSALRHAFVAHWTTPIHNSPLIISLIHRHSYSLTMLRDHVRELVGIYSNHNFLTHLGNGLVHSLIAIDTEMFSEKALYAWRNIWLEEGVGHAELEIPLRIFKAGIEYLPTQDERVLLDLVSTERSILRQALGLDPEP